MARHIRVRPRDKQRNRLYKSEEAARKEGCEGRKFSTIAEMQQYVDDLTKQRWFKNRFGVKHIQVVKTWGGTASAQPEDGWIRMPPCFFYEEVLLHEVAHHVQPQWTAWHGPEFCAILLELVERRMGVAEAAMLRKAMQSHRIAYSYVIRVLGNKPKPKVRRKTSATS